MPSGRLSPACSARGPPFLRAISLKMPMPGTRGTDGGARGAQNREQGVRGEIVTRLPNGSRRGGLSLTQLVCYGASASRCSPSLWHVRGVDLPLQHVTATRRWS